MKLRNVASGILLAALCTSAAVAGAALTDVSVSAGPSHSQTDGSGGFTLTGLKAGKHDILLTGNPLALSQ